MLLYHFVDEVSNSLQKLNCKLNNVVKCLQERYKNEKIQKCKKNIKMFMVFNFQFSA